MTAVLGRGAPSEAPGAPSPRTGPAGTLRTHGGGAALFLGVASFFLLSMRQTFSVPGTFGMSLAQSLFAGAALLWVFTIITRHAEPIRDRVVLIVVLAYVTASFLSFGASMMRGVPYVAQVALDRYILVDLCLLGMVLFILTVVRSTDAYRTIIGAIVLGGTASAGFALVMVSTGIDLAADFRIPGLKANDYVIVKNLLREGISRPQGSAGHPLELSAVLTVVLPLALALVFEARRRRSSTQWLWAGCTAVLMAGALVTVSRSAVVGTAAAVLVMCWRWPIRRIAVLVVVGGGAVGIGLALQMKFMTAMLQTFQGVVSDSSIKSRQIGLDYAATHFWEHPWLGQGVGAYPALKQPVLDNQYVSRLMEAGVIGLLAFVAALAAALFMAVRTSAARERSVAELGGGVAGSLAAVIIISLILDTAGFAQIWYLTWILVALAGVGHRLARDGEGFGPITTTGAGIPPRAVRASGT
ncbi:O-antigen ligase [Tsukamurella sp. 1534]|uniref:O-antigen ligase family protein n=1 Tax=Tsukamurella sp. 1534 TaxID=1151061 RepID=UPI0003149F15|nr:O-antigen ligase family protein [Tsukamurella sp. 1534]